MSLAVRVCEKDGVLKSACKRWRLCVPLTTLLPAVAPAADIKPGDYASVEIDGTGDAVRQTYITVVRQGRYEVLL